MVLDLQRKVDDVFAAALAARGADAGPAQPLPSAFDLTGLCGGDERVRREVLSLLSHLDAAGERESGEHFLDPRELHGLLPTSVRNLDDAVLKEWGGEAIGQRVGGFAIIGRLGEGGMGVVYVAEQQRPHRTVALKLIRRSSATPALLRRFEREAQLLGRLNHPGIAQIYAAGIADIVVAGGERVQTPYIAMELVEGPNILRFVRERDTSVGCKLDLIAQACDAVQHSHHRGVIHRDLKPANILVASDARPYAKVVDFGVARVVDDAAPEPATQLTGHMHVVGTLSYMSPEQIGSAAEVDTRCDVYALGAILYQLLADRLPIDVARCSLPEAARRILAEEPPRLSTVDRLFRGDLETIVAKALEKEPARRYQSAAELGRDIRHYLSGEPIDAKRDSLLYMMRRQATRYRNLALVASLLAMITVAFAVYVHRQERRQAQVRADAERAWQSAADSAARLAAELSASKVEQGRLLGDAGDIATAERFLWDEMLAHPGLPRARWALWELYSRNGCRTTFIAHEGESLTVCADPNGERFASGGTDGFLRLWSIPDGRKLLQTRTGLREIHGIAFAPDGGWVAVSGVAGAEIYELPSGRKRCSLALPPTQRVGAISAARDGRFVASLGADAVVRIWDVEGALVTTIPPGPSDALGAGQAVSFSPSSHRIAAGFANGAVRLWELVEDGGQITARPGPAISGHLAAVNTVSFNLDSTLIATGSMDRNVTLWDANTGAASGTIETRNGTAYSLSFSPDGKKIAVMGYWGAQFFDLKSHQRWDPPGINPLGAGGGYDVAYSHDGRFLITTGPLGTVRLWDLDGAGAKRLLSPTDSPVRGVAVGRRENAIIMASLQEDGTLSLRSRAMSTAPVSSRDAPTDNWTHREIAGVTPAQTLAMSPDTSQVLVGRRDGRISVVAREGGNVVQDLSGHKLPVTALCFTPDGKTFVSGSDDANIRFWRCAGEGASAGWSPGPVVRAGGNVTGAVISSDGAVLITTQRRTGLSAWSVPDAKPLGAVAVDAWRPALSSDGRWISVGLWDWSIQLWDSRDLVSRPRNGEEPRPVTSLVGHTQLVTEQAFDDSGELLATVSDDGKVKLWDVATNATRTGPSAGEPRRCLATLDGRAGEAHTLAFLPRPLQHQIAVGYHDGSVRIWDLQKYDSSIAGQLEFQRALRIPPHSSW